MNVYFDVDHTLIYVDQHGHTLRPGARHAIRTIKEAGHGVFVWSAGGAEYVERVVRIHELGEWVDGCFDKSPRVQPAPDVIIDDDWYLVEKYGGYLVSQYKVVNEEDREFYDILEKLTELGHL
jgi:hypothetical protein